MKIALCQFTPTVGDFAGNSERILSLAQRANERGADLAVFSELCLCGYFPSDLLERPAFIDRNQTELKRVAAQLPLPAIVGFVGRVKNGTGKHIAGHNDLRRRVERQELLAGMPVRSRPRDGTRWAGNYGAHQYFRLALHD